MSDTYVRSDQADLSFIDTAERVKKNKKKKVKYINVVAAFDIETSTLPIEEEAFMYIWQLQIEEQTIIGRTWPEFMDLMKRISDRLGEDRMAIYVHNLAFEFSFLKGVYAFGPDDVFCTDSRKVLRCFMYKNIEFRCSYHLTNMSLDMFLKKYSVPNKKLTYDYKILRYPWTPLNDQELAYCINDVKGLVQALKLQMKADGDNVATIPLTATGYVRKDTKKAMYKFNHKQLQEMLPDVTVYRLLREAYRGGDTLSNRWNTDEIIENIQSVDITSSYPSSMLMNLFPMSRFYREDPDDFPLLLNVRALLFRVTFVNIRVDMTEGHLYLSRDKCRNIDRGTFVNGRILQAGSLDTTITDVDYKIIKKRYKWDRMIITELYSASYRRLPSMFRNVIRDYYRVKTELKGAPEGSDEYIFYMKNKEKLNACYGMTVQDPGKDEIKYIDGEFAQEEKPLKELLEEFNKHAFLSYAWGVWVAAWSRSRLADGIDVVTKHGAEPANFIYSDTDSIKYIGDVDFTEYNNEMIRQAKLNNAYAADRDGVIHYMGVFEDEGYKLPNRFKTLGAKKYVLEDPDGKLHITIAGVNKKEGAEELGSIENFKEGFIFRKAGGTEALFNDNICYNKEVDGHNLVITDNVVIRDSTYTLGVTAEYKAILDGLIKIKYSDTDIPGLYKVKR